jgi:hypothetical protein
VGDVKLCGIYRRPGEEPDLSCFAQGIFGFGYFNEFRTPSEIDTRGVEDFDLVVIGGGMSRFGGRNGEIVRRYREAGVPVIICEFGRLIDGTILTLVNTKPWLPEEQCPPDRLEDLGLMPMKLPRGENILICGQRPDLDSQLAPAIEAMREASYRKIVYRPHPNSWRIRENYVPPFPFDEISMDDRAICHSSRASLQRDLDDAWCVVTHSSIVGVQALLRGIPVFAGPEFVCWSAAHGLEDAGRVEEAAIPRVDRLEKIMCRLSYTIWFEHEIRLGRAFTYLSRHLQ